MVDPGSPGRSTGPGTAPFVSVVLMASRHRDFVDEAIASIRAQSLPREEFELIAVCDFDDAGFEERLARSGGRSVHVPPGDIGPAIRAGLEAARGTVLTFLDDDDRMRPDRLASVAAAFRSDPDLGYLRNGYVIIDREGGSVPDPRFRSEERRNGVRVGAVTSTSDGWSHDRLRWPPLGLDFNSSSIAVRRAALDEFCRGRDLTGFILLDSLMFVAVLAGAGSIRFDPAPWTEYRIHGQNRSWNPQARTDPVAGRADFSRRSAESYARLARWAAESGSERSRVEAEGLLTAQQCFRALRDPTVRRSEFRRLRRAIRSQPTSYLLRSERLLPLALRVYSISPRWGRWLYTRRARAESL